MRELEADCVSHLGAVREMFEGCDVFIFTLGFTEGWLSSKDGAFFPLAPGVAASPSQDTGYEFRNFTVEEMVSDLNDFVEKLRTANSTVRMILTLSPVPLIATYEKRHVLVSTTYGKSALRLVAEIVFRSHRDIAYFPSYEAIVGPHGRYLHDDLRIVSPRGVAHVMSLFATHHLRAVQDVDTKEPRALHPVESSPTIASVGRRQTTSPSGRLVGSSGPPVQSSPRR